VTKLVCKKRRDKIATKSSILRCDMRGLYMRTCAVGKDTRSGCAPARRRGSLHRRSAPVGGATTGESRQTAAAEADRAVARCGGRCGSTRTGLACGLDGTRDFLVKCCGHIRYP
jgi:hypothetical protein